ncbi:hypothetical protein CAEBREN_15442 [Caenorhabditis brenneri]|uniref:ATP-dependent DNA helicase n=1 Tax=Caenorhabditis brenneri TaxID=135651 RepID=G0NDT5_CAEBE|nr:hypothetical protein CAEBREN_15442 [Caenorhabditis brenneri]
MPNRCKPSTSSACPPDNSFDSEDGMPLLDVSLAESEGSREIPVVMPALVLKLTRDDSDGKPASLDEHSSPGVGPSGDLNLDDAMETDDGPYRDREFYMALETVDGIEETQLMSQCSVRKRDKKKRKSASDAARQAAKRLAESQEEREKRLESVAERDALRRSEMSEKERMIVNQRKRDKAAVARENESEEAANERREADAARASARREAEDPESHAARNQDNAERTAAARANESPDETAARRLADRQRRSNGPKEFVPLAGTDDHPGAHYIGRMENPCRHCGALYFRAETTTKGQYTMCCANGSIDIPMPPPLPTALQDLYLLDDDEGERKDFIDNIRQYNNSMAMACMKAEVKLPSGGWYTYRIHKTTADVDRFISARLPDKNENPLLYDLVTSLMMHRPCGVHNPKAPCMKNDVCSKKFRKPFRKTTSIDNDGYALYARPDDGRTFEVKVNSSTVIQTNQDVVPYCAWLIEKYQCHINLEYCGTFSSVKYLYKYVYKGTTRACILIKVDQHGNETVVSDEIQQFLDTRYVCAPEAAHHIFQFPMSYRSVSVSQLPIHLPGEKTVIFEAGKESEAVDRARTKKSKLEAWFKVNDMCHNSQLPNGDLPAGLRDSRKFFYHEMPEHFVFNASSSTWQPRQKQFAIGRMYFISPRDREKFALRQLLLYTKGSRSFQDLRTVQGYEWPTFVEAARAAGFLSDDLIYEKTLQEAVEFKTGSQLRSLFVTLLLFETIDNAEELWNKFSKHLSDDFVNKGYTQYEAESLAYYEMMDRMEAASEDLRKWINRSYPRIFRRGDDVDIEKCKKEGEDALTKLNKEQREAVDAILGAKNSLRGGLFFIDGPGGTGKTFVYNCLANLVLGSGEKILPMSWVGIAAALLPGGRTVASAIKLDINNGCRSSGVNLKSPLADVLRQVSLILWDEAPMSPKASLETVDTLFRKLMDVDIPFGGKTVVLGGDFRQVLPVMDKGGAAEQIANSIKKSGLWQLFQVFHLKTNVRVTADALEWSKELLRIGDGKVGAKVTGEMPIPDGLESGGDLITEIFGDLLEKGEVEKLAKVAILTPRNKEALETNNKVLDKMGGAPRIYRSLDTISPKDGQLQVGDFNHFTTEFLNTMTPSGMPPHELRVKNGAIVMLLRNLDVKNGLCNGTRMVVEEMGERILQCKFINGPRKDESVLIPRIKLNYEKNLPFIMGRLQFPIRLAFAMTVNKSQGQTFERIGLLLDEPIFSHGQFYVALSRTTTREGVKINSKSKKVNNVVYPEVLLD